jgi:hypothetical protein
MEKLTQRTIKFRIWNGKRMIMPTKITNNNKDLIMQYTGVNDINGIEIYEGDFVVPAKYKDKKNIVQYIAHGFYRVKEINGKIYTNILGTCELIVIGNIYEP